MTSQSFMLICALAAVTYFTRYSGYLLIKSVKNIHPRVEAALNAVPAAVLTAIVAPALVRDGPVEAIAMIIAAIASFRLGLIGTLFIGVGFVIASRYMLG